MKLADKVGHFYDNRKNIIAKIEGQTIRHINCTLLIQEGTRCGACSAQTVSDGETQSSEKEKSR